MTITGIMSSLALMAFPAEAPRTPAATCAILQAAFASWNRRADPVYPEKLAPPRMRMGRIEHGGDPEFQKRIGVTSAELDDLIANQPATTADTVPDCAWKGGAIAYVDPPDRHASTAFTAPILSSDGKLALVEMSVDHGFSAGGYLCTMRLASDTWSGRCTGIWSIR